MFVFKMQKFKLIFNSNDLHIYRDFDLKSKLEEICISNEHVLCDGI